MPAFGRYDKKRKTEITEIPEWQKVMIKVLDADIAAAKKPVRWNFLSDNEGMFQVGRVLDPMMKLNEGLYKAITKKPFWTETAAKDFRKKAKERDYVEGFDEIAKGIETGKHDLLTSLGELLFTGTDAVANTDFISDFQKMMDKQKPDEPETWRGDLAALLVTYGAPLPFITKITNRAKKLQVVKDAVTKMGTSKASKIAQRVFEGATIVGATDFIASKEGRRVDPLLFTPESTKGLTGRKKAAAVFRNKVRFGAEGATVGGLFPLVGKGAQLLYKGVGRPIGGTALRYGFKGINNLTIRPASYLLSKDPLVVPRVAKAISGSTDFALRRIISPMLIGKAPFRQLPPFEQWRMFSVTSPNKYDRRVKKLDNFLSFFRSFGKAPKDIEGVGEKVMLYVKGRARRLDKLMEGIEKRAYRLAKAYETRHNKTGSSKAYERMVLDDTVDYLQGAKKLSALPKELRSEAFDLRQVLNKILTDFGKNLPKNSRNEITADLRKTLTGKLDNYLVRSFATFTNPKYLPDKAIRENAKNWILNNVVRKNKDLREAAIKGFPGFKELKAYERYADRIVDDILHVGRTPGKNPVTQLQEIGTKLLRQDKYRFLKTGEELPDVIKKLMGKQKDLRAQVLSTVTDATASTAQKAGFDRIAAIGLKNGWLFTSPEAARNTYIGAQQIGKIKRTGALNSTIENLYTSPELVQMFQGAGNVLDRLTSAAIWRQMLQFKVGVQMSKTLYSPQTQVRNVTSASFFALYNGHLGHAANVGDSFRMVIRDVFKAGKYQPIDDVAFNEYVEKLVRLGVWDENVVASELRAVMKNLRDGKINTEDEIFERLVKNLPTEKVARLYAGGDNLWKQYGYEFYKSDLRSALKSIKDVEGWMKLHGARFDKKELISGATKSYDDALDEAAAFALRNTYPTYSKVPPVVQELRKIPFFGNFVSFPSEMLRTGVTSIAMSLRHIASDNPVLRQMGYKQLMGAFLATYGLGTSLAAISYNLTGSTKEQWDAYKRSIAAPWDKNSQLYAVTGWENGKSAAINFSYFSPYDVLERPIEAALSMAAKQNIAPQDIDDYVMSQMFDPEGPLMELLEPFIAPAIGGERVLDVVSGNFLIGGRGGKTGEGARIYTDADELGDKFNKSLVHILKGVNPGITASGAKLYGGFKGDVSGAGLPMKWQDELLALLTGTRIIRIDAKKDLSWLASQANRLNRDADETSKFYKAKGYIDRPPSVMVDEFNAMQEKAFNIQRDFYIKLKDLMMLDLDEDDVKEILRKGGMNNKLINNLLDGEFTPINFSEPRFERKVETLENVAEQKSNQTTGYVLDEDFVYPKDELKDVVDDWKDKEFFPETYNKETKQMEGGYNPEEEGYKRDEKGKLIRDELGKPVREPTLLDKAVPFLKEKVMPYVTPFSGQRSQTPLPPTPSVNTQQFAQATPNISQTGLTHTENALLSNEEKAMRLKQRGMA